MAKKPAWLSSREAAEMLSVKLETLYAYASRGLVESVPGPRGRGRRYARQAVERLKARHDARSGHGAVAAGALRFGEPTLETSISDIRADGPYYRGHSALVLCERGERFESVFDLLVAGQLSGQPDWPRHAEPVPLPAAMPRRPRYTAPSTYLAALLGLAALADEARHGASDSEDQERARRLVLWLADAVGGRSGERRGKRVAERMLRGFGVRAEPFKVDLVDRALVLCADHELNASTFAARVAASTGADLYASLGAAMHTLSGPQHGGAAARVEAFLREIGKPARAASVLRERLARGERTPGFGHPMYEDGDPRGRALLALAEQAAARGRPHADYECMRALCEATAQAGHPAANSDAGLVALTTALALPNGAAAAFFAIGRIPGWVAHILEQRSQRYILRPRARYVPAPAE
jgi:citrate synthase